MNSLKYTITKSLIQGLYKGTLFSASIYIIFLTSNFLSGNSILVSSIIGSLSLDRHSMVVLSKLSDSMLYGYLIVILISVLLSLVSNLTDRKNK